MEQTLLLLKPDAVMRRGAGAAVLKEILDALPDATSWGFLELAVPQSLAAQHYAIHEGKFFYPWLLQFIQVGKVVATVLEGNDIVNRLREVLGATFVEKADPDSLRGKYGLVGGVNVAHASDEAVNAEKEVALWCSEAGLDITADGRRPMLAYIAKWEKTPVFTTQQIRSQCYAYTQSFTDRDRYVGAVTELLMDECPCWLQEEIQKLADAILGNMDLDREKS